MTLWLTVCLLPQCENLLVGLNVLHHLFQHLSTLLVGRTILCGDTSHDSHVIRGYIYIGSSLSDASPVKR